MKLSAWQFGMILLVFSACNPKIYTYDVRPRSIFQNDPVSVAWKVKGQGFLLIHDINYPGATPVPLHDLTLLVTLDGKQTAYPLHANDTIRIPVPTEDSLIIQKQPDHYTENRLRYVTLVAALHGKEAPATIQVEIRMDADSDVVAFVPKQRGDSLVASGENSSTRWGDNFVLGSASTGSDRPLVVTHAGITTVLRPGETPDEKFKGTPVKGSWSISTPMTAEEKNGSKRTPSFLKVNITIIHQ